MINVDVSYCRVCIWTPREPSGCCKRVRFSDFVGTINFDYLASFLDLLAVKLLSEHLFEVLLVLIDHVDQI